MGSRVERLVAGGTCLVLAAADDAVPTVLHFGPPLPGDPAGLMDANRPQRLPASPDMPVPLSLLPVHGLGFFGRPGFVASRPAGDWCFAFRATMRSVDGAIVVELVDGAGGVAIAIHLALDPESGVLSVATSLTNRGAAPLRLDWLAALALPLPPALNEVLLQEGRWGAELSPGRFSLDHQQELLRTSRCGRTGHAGSPTVVVGEAGFGETTGRVIGCHLAWSGNHQLAVEVLPDGSRQLQLGEWLLPGEVTLGPGEVYPAPLVYAAWSGQGLSGVSQRFHAHIRRRIARPQPRPVHLNTWEAVYFRHEFEELGAIAEAAAGLGVERFVLDDGWFGRRDDDCTSLGDWAVDSRKYPDGLGPLIAHVRGLGMGFGLWVEPEMVSPESALYRAHPDWVLAVPGRERPTGRRQLVLDLTRPEVFEHTLGWLDALLNDHAIDYLKWDHNRDLAPAASAGRPAARAQTLAVYRLLDTLRARHPAVVIEACASGGGRMDLGILARTDRFWPSDNNDPLVRQRVQRGASLVFPLEVLGAHVGPSPSHQTGRRTALQCRCRTALFGHLGLELDPRRFSAAEATAVRGEILLYKRFRDLLHSGRLWRLEIAAPAVMGQLVVGADGSEALAQLVCSEQPGFSLAPPVRLPGLDRQAGYRLELVEPWPEPAAATLPDPAFWRGRPVLDGGSLAEVGIRLPLTMPETIWLLYLERV